MSVRTVAVGVGDRAFSAMKGPVALGAQALGVAIGTTKAVRGVVSRLVDDMQHREHPDAAREAGGPREAAEGPTDQAATPSLAREVAQEEVLVTPPQEPPVPVVEQALAAEAAGDQAGQGRATEPSASSRDEAHGDARLQPAEQEEWADEVVEGLAEDQPAGDVDVETPVGTTGADAGYNPDTAEADLQQPETEPLMDPSLTKSVKSESDTLGHASDPEKG